MLALFVLELLHAFGLETLAQQRVRRGLVDAAAERDGAGDALADRGLDRGLEDRADHRRAEARHGRMTHAVEPGAEQRVAAANVVLEVGQGAVAGQ